MVWISRERIFLLAIIGNILAYEEIPGLSWGFNFKLLNIIMKIFQNVYGSPSDQHVLETPQSQKVFNAVVTSQPNGNIRKRRIELIDDIIEKIIQLFSQPSNFFWLKRNNISSYDCFNKIIKDNGYENYFDQKDINQILELLVDNNFLGWFLE